MQLEQPLRQFQSKQGQLVFRLNFLTEGVSDVSHFTEGLSIYIEDHSKGFFYQQTFTLENLPKEAITIFFDIRTLFDYIVDNHPLQDRIKLVDQGLLVCNIIKVKSTQRRQQVLLPMTRVPLEKQIVKSKIQFYQNPEIKAHIYTLLETNTILQKQTGILRKDVIQLEKNVQKQKNMLKILEENQSNQKKQMNESISLCKISIQQITLQHQNTIKQVRMEQRYLIQSVNKLKQELAIQKNEKQELKDMIKELRETIKMLIIKSPNINLSKGDILGQRVAVSIDRENAFLNRFKIEGNQIEKIKDDQTRFQILGKQILGKVSKSYYQVKIIKLATGNLLLGLVNVTRKGQRHSYDQKQCVCFEGTGKIFQMGKRMPSFAKFQSGQTIRVVLDLELSMVKWLLGHTEIASVLIPSTFNKTNLVPYIQLNQLGDRICLNG